MNEDQRIALENARKKLKKQELVLLLEDLVKVFFAEFGDELLAGLKSGFLLNPFNKVFKDRYIDERNKIRESLKAYEEQFPGTTTTGKIAGGTTTALASAMIPQTRILKTGSGILKKGANLAGGGALVGSATAYWRARR